MKILTNMHWSLKVHVIVGSVLLNTRYLVTFSLRRTFIVFAVEMILCYVHYTSPYQVIGQLFSETVLMSGFGYYMHQ